MHCDKNCIKCTGKYCVSKVYIFSTLQPEAFKKISDIIITRKYRKGQVIFFEGDVEDKLYIVNQGKIKIYKYNREGREQILYILSEGKFIGDMSLLKKGNFQFNAEALEDTLICTIAKDDFDEIITRNPEITLKILEVLHDRLMSLENLIQNLSTKDIETRIASMLLSFAGDFGVEDDNGIVIDLPLNREEMANYIGVTRETISRKLTSLQDDGVIELIGNKRLIIKNKAYFQNMM
ncbi:MULTISPECIES: Crp/Fnr family transcriptional regulator [Clostridium]|uniref:Crp/Fnr family transcriptional regulator n=1 Tax=Clostridium TaxID=1485 RepID=UPI00069F10B9|nr:MULTISPECIES: Crp/Fnr family transcriptional regulator [Clostridium]KOF56830.1 Crp/Fnr family transcriptional regulator [Clostridium sp. DMHC 10]MCD2347776.1 Crp/Fnr family transcriptional regulator [Clostridium guangxiense]